MLTHDPEARLHVPESRVVSRVRCTAKTRAQHPGPASRLRRSGSRNWIGANGRSRYFGGRDVQYHAGALTTYDPADAGRAGMDSPPGTLVARPRGRAAARAR